MGKLGFIYLFILAMYLWEYIYIYMCVCVCVCVVCLLTHYIPAYLFAVACNKMSHHRYVNLGIKPNDAILWFYRLSLSSTFLKNLFKPLMKFSRLRKC